jgi:single-stranded DNA-binding protein
MPEIKNPMLATATITGRACHSPEVKAFGDGKMLAKFSIAQDVFKKGTKSTNFWDVVCFGYAAQDAEKLSRGEHVYVAGRLDVDAYTGKDGTEKKRVVLTADTVRSMQWPAKDGGAPQEADLEPKTADDDIPF